MNVASRQQNRLKDTRYSYSYSCSYSYSDTCTSTVSQSQSQSQYELAPEEGPTLPHRGAAKGGWVQELGLGLWQLQLQLHFVPVQVKVEVDSPLLLFVNYCAPLAARQHLQFMRSLPLSPSTVSPFPFPITLPSLPSLTPTACESHYLSISTACLFFAPPCPTSRSPSSLPYFFRSYKCNERFYFYFIFKCVRPFKWVLADILA